MEKPKLFDYLNEIFINSILSGPKTQIVNAVTNQVNSFFSPVERGLSAVIESGLAKLQGRQAERFLSEVPTDAWGALQGYPDGLRGFLHTLKTGKGIHATTKYERPPPSFKGKLGRVINFPTTVLEAADNLNFQMNFRAAFDSEILRIGKSQGLKGKALIDFIAQQKIIPSPELLKKATDIANYRLFRQEGGAITEALYKIRDLGFNTPLGRVAVLKYVIPFVRTPVNLAKYGLERSPLALLDFFTEGGIWHKIAAKSPEAADQLARAFIGSTIAGTVALLFAEDKITSAAPLSTTAKDRFYREGKQPYSIKIGDRWVSYQRLEPFNTSFTMVALVVDAVDKEDADVSDKVWAAINSFSKNFVSQTYMSGLSDLLNAANNPESYGSNMLESTAQAILTPGSSAMRTIVQATDKTMRKPGNFVETIENGIPFLSWRVPPRLNVFGEPSMRTTPWFSPINISQEQESVLNTELSKHEVNIGFVGDSINGVKLTAKQQQEYQELAGGMAKKAILRLIKTDEYKSLNSEDAKAAIESAANKAKSQARIQMIQEGTVESSTDNLTEIGNLKNKWGTPIGTVPFNSIDPQKVYDGAAYFSETKGLLKNVKIADVKDPGAIEVDKAVKTQTQLDVMRGSSLTSLNTDPTKGDTYRELYNQWQARSKLTDQASIDEFDKDTYTKDAYKGNFSSRELDLLNQYSQSTDKKQFLKDHPELTLNPREEWLKAHPEDNARLAIWGQAKVLTQAAYDKAQQMIKDLDIPDNAVADYLPPKEIAKPYFDYEAKAGEFGANSAEARLIRVNNPGLTEYLKLSPIDTPVKVLELQVKNRDLQTKYDAFSDKESSSYIADDKARDKARADWKKQNTGYVDDIRRIEAINNKAPDVVIDSHLKYMKIQDAPGVGSSSAETMLYRVDDPEYDKWRTDAAIWGDQALKPVDQGKIPVWRIDVKYTKQDAEYQKILDQYPSTDNKGQKQATEAYLKANPDYATARTQRTGFQMGLQGDLNTKWVEYNALPGYGYSKERYRMLNPDFDTAVMTHQKASGGTAWTLVDPAKIPSPQYDALYEKYKADFDAYDKVEGTSTQKAEARTKMLADNPQFKSAYYQRDAYALKVPDKYVPNYAVYYSLPEKGWTKERYLKDNPDFYTTLRTIKMAQKDPSWVKPIDFSKVPTAKVESLLDIYNNLPTNQKQREAFRAQNPDLDKYLVDVIGLTPLDYVKKRTTESEFIERFIRNEQLVGIR
jgi:hypothetical protein